jgi:hypothetical protein
VANYNYTYTLTNGTTADANQVMQNFNDARTQINGNIDHTNILLTDSYTYTNPGRITFSGANTLVLPTAAPTVTSSVSVLNNQLNIFDGTTSRIYVPVDKVSSGTYNLGLKLSAGALSVTGLGNTALAITNAGWVSPSSTADLGFPRQSPLIRL